MIVDLETDDGGARTASELALERKIDEMLSRSPKLVSLEAQLYGHVLECIDFDRLFMFEQLLWGLVDRLDVGKLDEEGRVSRAIIRRALVRAADDPSTAFTDVPYGITKAEARAAKYDPECVFCRYEDDEADTSTQHDHDDGACPLCDDLAREWREQHADALQRARARRATVTKGAVS